jgi:hypothetical protein
VARGVWYDTNNLGAPVGAWARLGLDASVLSEALPLERETDHYMIIIIWVVLLDLIQLF